MSTALDLLEALQKVNIEAIAQKAMADNADNYVLLNQGQMLEGKGKDRNIGTYRNFRMPDGRQYRDYKYEKSALAGKGNVDLKDTGAFYKGMKMTMNGNEIDVSSSDSKESDLVDKYGGQIYGLNIKNTNTFVDVAFAPDFQAIITQETGLQFN
jgi:hypothetical protein